MAYDGSLLFETSLDTSGFNKGVKEINKLSGNLTSTFKNVGASIASAFAVQKLVEFGKQSVSLASDLQEVQNVVEVSFGEMSYKMEQFAETAIEAFGLSQLEAKRTGSTFMAMAAGMQFAQDTASDMSLSLTALSSDMASFYNVNQSETKTALSAIFTGETETLKRYGILITEVNLQEYARQRGITKSINAMTQQEKVLLRYNYVMNATKLAQGDFARTSDSWANQTRMLNENWKELCITLGQVLIPVLSKAIPVFTFLIQCVQQLVVWWSGVNNVAKTFMGLMLVAAGSIIAITLWTNILTIAKISLAGVYAILIPQVITFTSVLKASLGWISLIASLLMVVFSLFGGNSESIDKTNKALTTAQKSALGASEGLDTMTDSVKSLGKANKSLAGFDEINTLSSNGKSDFLDKMLGKGWEEKFKSASGYVEDLSKILEETLGKEYTWSINYEEVKKALKNAGKTGEKVLSTASDAGLKFLENASKAGEKVLSTASDAGLKFLENASKAGEKVLSTASNAGSKMLGIIWVDAPKKILEATAEWCTSVWENVKTAWCGFWDTWDTGWESIKEWWNDIWSNVTEWGTAPLEDLKLVWDSFWNAWDNGDDSLKVWFSSVWNEIGLWCDREWVKIKNSWDVFWDTWKTGWESIKEWFSTLWTNIAEWCTSVWENVKTAWCGFWDTWDTGWESIKEWWNDVWACIENWCTDVWDGIKTTWEDFWNNWKSGSSNVEKWLSGALSPLKGKKEITISSTTENNGTKAKPFRAPIPRLATGTVIPARMGEFLAILGDNRREAEVVSPLSTIKQAVLEANAQNSGQNGVYVIHTHVHLNGREIGEAVEEFNARELIRGNGRRR